MGGNGEGQISRADRCAPDQGGGAPGGGGAKSQGNSYQKYLNDPVDSGIGVAIDNVPHSVGKQKTRYQQHQGADGHGVGILDNADGTHGIGQQSHQKRGGDGTEKLIRFPVIEKLVDKAHQHTAEPGAKPVGQIRSEEDGESGRTQKAAQVLNCHRIVIPVGEDIVEPFLPLRRVWFSVADSTAQTAELLHRVQIIAVMADAAHPGNGLAVPGENADRQTVGNGKDFRLQAVSPQHSADAFLHAEGLRAAHGQLIAQVCSEVQ